MAIDLIDYEERTREAVRFFWETRMGAQHKQVEAGRADQGERAGVTGGKNLDGFANLVHDIVSANGLPDAQIHIGGKIVTLPGYFRPTKLWDLLVIHDSKLIAAIEFKSHIGPSFGNNFNNRTEEAVGTAHDLWVAYREGALGDQTAPFVGWLMLVEDAEKSRKPVRDNSPHFPIFDEFCGASYQERYRILCRRLMQETLYTAASVITTSRDSIQTGEYRELDELTGLKTFVSELAGHVAIDAARS